jgi:hypothetical protein
MDSTSDMQENHNQVSKRRKMKRFSLWYHTTFKRIFPLLTIDEVRRMGMRWGQKLAINHLGLAPAAT